MGSLSGSRPGKGADSAARLALVSTLPLRRPRRTPDAAPAPLPGSIGRFSAGLLGGSHGPGLQSLRPPGSSRGGGQTLKEPLRIGPLAGRLAGAGAAPLSHPAVVAIHGRAGPHRPSRGEPGRPATSGRLAPAEALPIWRRSRAPSSHPCPRRGASRHQARECDAGAREGVKITDLASLTWPGRPDPPRRVLGSPLMAPGRSRWARSTRSDLTPWPWWPYEMLTGVVPFRTASVGRLVSSSCEPPPRPRTAPTCRRPLIRSGHGAGQGPGPLHRVGPSWPSCPPSLPPWRGGFWTSWPGAG
jgi:hypothetical protein